MFTCTYMRTDASLLHSEDHVYMETAAHMAQLKAYLYSWLKSALPIDSVSNMYMYKETYI
jgi:hypothetical protein